MAVWFQPPPNSPLPGGTLPLFVPVPPPRPPPPPVPLSRIGALHPDPPDFLLPGPGPWAPSRRLHAPSRSKDPCSDVFEMDRQRSLAGGRPPAKDHPNISAGGPKRVVGVVHPPPVPNGEAPPTATVPPAASPFRPFHRAAHTHSMGGSGFGKLGCPTFESCN